MKKLIAILMSLALIFALSACSSDNSSSASDGKKETIGIIQFGSHGSLNNCYDGVIAGLKEAGIDDTKYNIELLNSNFDAGVSQTQANNLVNKKAKVIIAIATPSAMAAANAAADSDTPVVYCAITDPSVMANYDNITGSSDVPNFEKQLEVVTAFMGKSDLKIGVIYSTEESSSPFQIEKLKEAAAKYSGMTVLDSAVADITTIDAKTNDLVSQGVDCFINLLDNTIVGKLETNILPITNEKSIPVFGSEIEQVNLASASIEYVTVGKSAGKAAAEIIGGKSASDIPVAVITDPTNYYNSEALARFGLSTPQNITAVDVCK